MTLRKPKGIVYDLELPELKRTIQYRAFKVGEQKELLTCIAMKDEVALINKIVSIVEACTFGKVDMQTLPMYLVDQIFLSINTKSVGNKMPAQWQCGAVVTDEATEENPEPQERPCGAKMQLMLDMDKAYMSYPDDFQNTTIIDVDDFQKVKLRVPSFEDYKKIDTKANWMDVTSQFIFACIDCIIDGDEVKTPGVDFSFEEAEEWINELDGTTLAQITDFYQNMPKLVLDINVTCPVCGNKEETKLAGLEDFFT